MKTFSLLFFALLLSTGAHAQTLGSCKIFPSNNPWNQRVDTMRVDSVHSAAYIASVGASIHVHPDFGSDPSYGIPWVAVNSGQAMVPIDLSNGYADQSDPGPMPIPPGAPVEQPAPPGGDGHVLVVDTSNHHLYELYQGIKGSGSGWAATSSAVFGLDSNNYRADGWTSCDAAGLPIWPGLVRKYECDAGEIKHALRFTIGGKNSNGTFKNISQKGWIFPARHEAGGTSDTMAMPMGVRLRLSAKFDDSKYTGYAKVITTALKKYGMILADNGSPWYISGETNINWPDDDIGQLKAIMGSDFEVVYTGPVRTQPNQFPDPILPIPPEDGGNGKLSVVSFIRDTARVGDQNAAPIPITNIGGGALAITHQWLKYGTVFQIADSAAASIAAGGQGIVNVNFSPIVHGLAVDTLFIASSDSALPVAAVPLLGWGTQGFFRISANPLDFGSVTVGNTDSMFVEVKNTGDGELDIFANSRTGTNTDFTLFALAPQISSPFILEPGDSEIAGFIFAPTVVGPDTSVFSIVIADTASELYDTDFLMIGVGLAGSSVASAAPEPFGLTIFPNPASASATISVTGVTGPSQIEITDQVGRNLLTQTIPSRTTPLDLSTYPNGCYFLHVQTSHGDISKLIEVLH